MSESAKLHKTRAHEKGPVPSAIITVSDTRTPETDKNAHYLRPEIEAAGHIVAGYRLIKDEPDQVAQVLDELASSDAQVLLWNGGTGVSKRDTTFDVLSTRLDKTLPGFGEIFRMLSYQEIGAAAMLSRATAGVYKGKIVFSTPGSPNEVRLAREKLLKSAAEHLAWEVTR